MTETCETSQDAAAANPYAPPVSKAGPHEAWPASGWRSALSAALWTILLAFPVAALTALVFRFPVPFVGYLSGTQAVVPAIFALLFYGLLFGGFPGIALIGAAGGFVAGTWLRGEPRRRRWMTRLWALSVATAAMLALAVLDKIIGPW